MLNQLKMKRQYIKYILIGVVLGSLVLFIAMTDLQEVLDQIQRVGSGFFWVMLISFIAYLAGCYSWKYCFEQSNVVSIHRLFYIRTVGELVTLFNPTNIVAGEASKFYLLRHVPLTSEEKLDSILLSRCILIASQIVLAIVCCFWLNAHYENGLFLLIGAITLSVFCLMILAMKDLRFVLKLCGRSRFRMVRMGYINLRNIQTRICQFVRDNPDKIVLSYIAATVHWICGAGEIFTILYVLGLDPLMMQCVIVDTCVVVIKSLAGFIPGQIGVEELSNKWLLSMVGIQGATVWLTVSLLRRAKQLIWICISAICYALDHYVTKQKLIQHGSIICDT